MNALIGFILLLVVALIGWGIAALKYNVLPYTKNEDEVEKDKADKAKLAKEGYDEMNIKDVMRIISTDGYQAV